MFDEDWFMIWLLFDWFDEDGDNEDEEEEQ